MKNKALYLGKNSNRHSTGWMRAMSQTTEREDTQFKIVRRLHSRYVDPWVFSNYGSPRRSWKAHSKCRRQWEKHEFGVFDWLGTGYLDRPLAMDHYRSWVLERLRQKKTCVFDIHHEDNLFDVLDSLAGEGICTTPLRLDNGLYEVTLLKQVSKHPHKKTSPGDKGTKGKYHRRHEQRDRQNKRQEAIDAVAERSRRASRKADNGIAFAPIPTELLIPPPKQSAAQPYSPSYDLCRKAKDDHIKGINRNKLACLTLLNNYSRYSAIPKAHIGLAPYERDYHKLTNPLDQCCAWLTGHSTRDFPAWVMTLLTDYTLDDQIAQRVFNWTIGDSSARISYGLSKNEVREFVHLPASIDDEEQAIAAAIARARHCDDNLTANLVKQLPNFYDLLNEYQRDSCRKIVEWLGTLPVAPDRARLHDLLDFFKHSRIFANPLFSFKGRTLQSVVRLMEEWHQQQEQERQLAAKAVLEMKWDFRGYDYSHNNNCYCFNELTSAQELWSEGQAQHNCVFSYRDYCLSGRTSIVSMQGINPREHLTIEINNSSRRIIQIRGVCNRLPTNKEMRIVRIFASVKNLTIYY